MSVVIAWAEPPAPEPKKIDLLRDELKERPGEWALIQSPGSVLFFPWWEPLRDDPLFEVKSIIKPAGDGIDKALEVYARYVGRPS